MRVAFVGNPNTGKSTLVSSLSGRDIRVANWPGTTVESISAQVRVGEGVLHLVDLPGVYDLLDDGPDAEITLRELLENPPDAIVNVLDASHLERGLHLTLELMELGIPILLVLNMVDEARRSGVEVDSGKLEEVLGIPVVETVAVKGRGKEEVLSGILRARVPAPPVSYGEDVESALEDIASGIEHPARRWLALALLMEQERPFFPIDDSLRDVVEEWRRLLSARYGDLFLYIEGRRISVAHEISSRVVSKRKRRRAVDEWLDALLMNPVAGPVFILLFLIFSFRFAFFLSSPWVDFINTVSDVLGGWILSAGIRGIVASFLIEGVISGVGTVLSFAPVLFLFYLVLGFMEYSGIMARMAFALDTLMAAVGLPGKAFVPLVMGFGCNVPAVYATRTLESFYDRLRVALMIPFMGCSARLPVLVLFASVFFPHGPVPVVLSLYLLGMIMAFITGAILSRMLEYEAPSLFEIPPYRFPDGGRLVKTAWDRTLEFLRGAGTIIMAGVVLVWLTMHLRISGESLYSIISRGILPIFRPMGIQDWRLTGALIPGFVSKEVILGALAVGFSDMANHLPIGFLEGIGMILDAFARAVRESMGAPGAIFGIPGFRIPPVETSLGDYLSGVLTPAGALAYMVFVLLYTPCVATVAAIKQEFGGRWALLSVLYQMSVAFILALFIYKIAVLIHG